MLVPAKPERPWQPPSEPSSTLWMKACQILLRGWLIVTAVSLNVTNISEGRWGWAGVSAFLVSATWWLNARSASHTQLTGGWVLYGLGAALGTWTGMYLGGLL